MCHIACFDFITQSPRRFSALLRTCVCMNSLDSSIRRRFCRTQQTAESPITCPGLDLLVICLQSARSSVQLLACDIIATVLFGALPEQKYFLLRNGVHLLCAALNSSRIRPESSQSDYIAYNRIALAFLSATFQNSSLQKHPVPEISQAVIYLLDVLRRAPQPYSTVPISLSLTVACAAFTNKQVHEIIVHHKALDLYYR